MGKHTDLDFINNNIVKHYGNHELFVSLKLILDRINHARDILGKHGKILQQIEAKRESALNLEEFEANKINNKARKEEALAIVLEKKKAVKVKYQESIDLRERYVLKCLEPYVKLKEEIEFLNKFN